jgi:lambda family phage tail tape measure protein
MPQAERELARSLRQVSEEADRAREALSQKAASLRTDDIPALEAYRQAMVEVARAEEEQAAWVRDHAAEQDRLNGLMSTGFDRAIKRYADSSRSVADQTEEAFTRAFANMEDALMTFLNTGKLSFADFARSLIADMARIELRALLTNKEGGGSGFGGIVQSALSGIMGLFGGGGSSPLPGSLGAAGGLPLPSFARGGAFGPFGPIEAFANGGILHQPTLFRFARGGTLATGLGGEAGPEAIMPLARDRSGRLGVRGGGGPNITVNVAGGNGPPSLIRANAGRGAREVLSILAGARRYG